MSFLVATIVRLKCATLLVLCGLFALAPLSSFALGNISLAWDASADVSVVNYKVYYGSASGTYTNSVQVGNVTTATVSNLVDGVTYYFASTALDADGLESDFSNEAVGSVNLPNQPPSLNPLSNITINEDSGFQTVNLSGITSGAANELQSLTVTATSSNPSLIPDPSVSYTSPNATGSLNFTPVASAFGSATITVTVNDGGTSNNVISRSFIVTVNSVNDTPTLNALANVTINENAEVQTVNLSGVSSGAANEVQSLTVTAISSNPGLIPGPTVFYTSPNSSGSLSFTPVASASGSATITVTVNDGGTTNNTVTRSFSVTVNQVNQPPTISIIANSVTGINKATAPIPFTIGDRETAAGSLTLSASSDNQVLVPNANVILAGSNSSRTLTITPAPEQSGIALISIVVSDGSASATKTFQLSVSPRPLPPANLKIAVK
ncbi:MAG: Ig-like domain-containing protein [Verrucomicrobiota bacterium]